MRNELIVDGAHDANVQIIQEIEKDEWRVTVDDGCEFSSALLDRHAIEGLRDGLTQLLEAS